MGSIQLCHKSGHDDYEDVTLSFSNVGSIKSLFELTSKDIDGN